MHLHGPTLWGEVRQQLPALRSEAAPGEMTAHALDLTIDYLRAFVGKVYNDLETTHLGGNSGA